MLKQVQHDEMQAGLRGLLGDLGVLVRALLRFDAPHLGKHIDWTVCDTEARHIIDQLTWRTSLEEARVEARQLEKDLLVHLDNPTRDGCGVMRGATYADPRVIVFVNEFAIPVEFSVAEDPGAQLRFRSFWTPTVMYLDPDGHEHRRTYGCLDPARFLAEFWLARGLRYLQTGHFRKAAEVFCEAIHYTSPAPDAHAENLYWIGVARYRSTGSVHELESEWRALRNVHPDSSWTRKTDFFFQLEDGT